MTDQPSRTVTDCVRNAIGPTMLLGLQDAELHDEPGEQRIREWVDWIAGTITPIIDREVQQEVDRIRAAVTEGKGIGRPLTASDVMVAHEVTRKSLAHALDAGLHLNWPQLVDQAQRSHDANAAWFQDVRRVRDLHTRGKTTGCCNDCGMVWPCTTIQALESKEPTT
ncbi:MULTISPECIES: hypothetical protein [unclassified Streptomyces]|uniref:hypothetical protein n=1 Tax=unclassified Streptomyces TaxID=2593676 RepID=UPI0036EF0B91